MKSIDEIAAAIASLLMDATSEQAAAMALEKAREMARVSWAFKQSTYAPREGFGK